MNLDIVEIDATQRGRRCWLHEPLTRSITIKAVVFGSTVAGFNIGGGSAFVFAHSSTMVAAPASVENHPAVATNTPMVTSLATWRLIMILLKVWLGYPLCSIYSAASTNSGGAAKATPRGERGKRWRSPFQGEIDHPGDVERQELRGQ
jgi:hypothetical protein